MRELGRTSIGGTAGNTDQPVPAADPQAPAPQSLYCGYHCYGGGRLRPKE